MQGSFGDTREKIPVKKKDSENRKVHKADRDWRKRRINRHNEGS